MHEKTAFASQAHAPRGYLRYFPASSLAIAVAMALNISTPANAAGVERETSSQSARSASVSNTWTLSGAPSDVVVSDLNLQQDPRVLANALIERIRDKGYLSYYIVVDVKSKSIQAVSAAATTSGMLKHYLPESITQDALSSAMPLMREAARSMGGSPDIDIGKVENGTLPVDAGVRPGSSTFVAGIGASSNGSRYAATDTASAFIQGAPINGLNASATLSHGLSDLRDESKDGRYTGLSLNMEAPRPFGILGMSYTYSDSVQGGVYAPLDLNQQVHTGEFYYRYPFRWGQIKAGIKRTDMEMEFGIVNMTSEQQYTALMTQVEYGDRTEWTDELSLGWNITYDLTAGIDQDTTGLLYGTPPDDRWMVHALTLKADQPLGQWLIQGQLGGQWSDSKNVPSHEKFQLGGAGKGSAYYPGVFSSHEGWFANARLYMPSLSKGDLNARPYAGYSYSTGTWEYGDNPEASSVEAGIKINAAGKLVGELGYAKAIDNRFNIDYDDRVMFNLTYLF